MLKYYIDESGHSGDLASSTGKNYDFEGQPYFTLAAVGITDLSVLDKSISALRLKHKIPEGELKSKGLQSKPKFVAETIELLISMKCPILVEIIDKRYFICIEIVNCILMPPLLGYDGSRQVWWMKNVLVDWLYDRIPNENLNQLVEACRNPSDHALMSVLGGLLRFSFSKPAKNEIPEIAECLRQMVEETIKAYGEMRIKNQSAHLSFLPMPDINKRQRKVWMLPNLSSLTNLYARLNLLHKKKLNGIQLVHDQQSQFDEILVSAKLSAEKQDGKAFTPYSDYNFIEKAGFEFVVSDRNVGIQCADILAGTVMRYFRDTSQGTAIAPPIRAVMKVLLAGQELRTGFGINQVVPSRMVLAGSQLG